MISRTYGDPLALSAHCAHNGSMPKQSRIFIRVGSDDRRLFREVAEALGLDTVSDAVRFVMREKYRELFGLNPKPKKGRKR